MRALVDGEQTRRARRRGAGSVFAPLRAAGARRDARHDPLRRAIAEREINAATDNPLFFPTRGEPFDLQFRANWPSGYRGDHRLAYSAGNFHGQPLALAADFLTIASPSWRTSPSAARRCSSTAITIAACRRTSPRAPA
jgi:histidine ammonia-lyase